MTEPKADQGNIVWIDDAKGNNNNDGLSQDTPVQSIDKALELAGEDGTIMVLDAPTIRDKGDLFFKNITLKRADGNTGYLLYFMDCKNITFDNVVIDGNNKGGGFPFIRGFRCTSMTFNDSTLKNNIGGAIDVHQTPLTITNGEIFNCAAAITLNTSPFRMDGGSIHNNKDHNDGAGAIEYSTSYYHRDPIQLILDGVDIYENSGQTAGAIYIGDDADLVISDSKIRNNRTSGNGGAMRLFNSNTSITNCIISGNHSSANGGGIHLDEGTLTLNGNTKVTNNQCHGGDGGGIAIDLGKVILNDTSIVCNNGNPPGQYANDFRLSSDSSTLQVNDPKLANEYYTEPDSKCTYPIDGYYHNEYQSFYYDPIRYEGTITGKNDIIARYDGYFAYYEFKPVTGSYLPSQIPPYPIDRKVYLPGSTVFAIQPDKTAVIGTGRKEDGPYKTGLWTFEGYDADSKVVNDENLVKPNQYKRKILFTGMWKWEDTTEVPWYYDIYYETFDKTTGKSEWKLFKEASGGKKQYNQKVDISHDRFDGTDMKRLDITGNQNETLGTHYVFDEIYGSHRLSANAIDAIQTNPLKIYYRAAQHNVTYEYEGTVPNGAAALPATEQKPYSSSVQIAEEPSLEGYVFSGWKIKSPSYMDENGLVDNNSFTMPNEDVTLVGSWTPVEKKTLTMTPQDIISYTGGDSIHHDTFPAARYKIEAEGSMDLSQVTFTVNGEKKKLPDGTKSGDIVALPWLNGTYTLKHESSTSPSTPEGSAPANDDTIAGIYEIRVNFNGVTASEGSQSIDLHNQPGTLTVRNVSDPKGVIEKTVDITQPVVSEAGMVNTANGLGTAVIPNGTRFYTNGKSELDVAGLSTPQISLLFDELLPGKAGENTRQLLIDRAKTAGYVLEEGKYQFKYLDLINENDGNAWMSTDEGTNITIYWPCPSGIPAEATVKVLHFNGLHREYKNDLKNQVNNSNVEAIPARVENGNIIFSLAGNKTRGSFSPFAIYWTETDQPTPPNPGKNTGTLMVSKTVAGNEGEPDKEFHFKVTLNDTSVTGTYGGMTFKDGVASFALKHGESMTASGLDAGMTYSVTEQEANQGGYTTTSTGANGTIVKDQTATAGFTNTRESKPMIPNTGNLVVSKTVSGSRGSTTKNFTFTISLGDTSINGKFNEVTFHNGVAVFTLKHGESITASGLPAGIRYTVTESDNSGYTVTAAGDTGTIEADKTATATFHNYRGGSGSSDNNDNDDDDDDINVTVQKIWKLDNGRTAPDSITVMLRKNGREYDQAILNEQNGWRCTWYGLNSRYSWTVEEVEVPEGFTMSLRRHGHKFTIVNDDTPVMPGTPDNPSQPGGPNASDTPDTPDIPGAPITPDMPNIPGTPDQTGKPETLRQPGTPGQPVTPEQPGTPGQPGTTTKSDKVPQTGDTANLALWVTLLAVSGTGLIASFILIKKKKHRGNHTE